MGYENAGFPTHIYTHIKNPLEACKSTLNTSLTSILSHFMPSSQHETPANL